jgi:outer membrane usher protein
VLLCRGAILQSVNKAVACLALFLAVTPDIALAVQQVTAVRIGLEQDHTRIVFQTNSQLRSSLFFLINPERAVLELEDVELNGILAGLAGQVGTDHPYIKSIRIVRTNINLVRIELDFTTEVEPRFFNLKPEAGLGYRLVLDIYPLRATYSIPAIGQKAPLPASPLPQIITQKPLAPAIKPAPQSATPAAAPANTALEEMWLMVHINRQEQGETVPLLRRNDGRLLARREDLRRWRLRVPEVVPQSHNGEAFYPLDALRGLSYRVDETAQTLELDAAPGLFGMTEIKGTVAGFSSPTPSPPGGFFNYDVAVDRMDGQSKTSGLFELGAFGSWSSGTSTFVGRDYGDGKSIVRLDTTWTHDRPAELATVRLGDAISSTGGWGRSVRFGGVQWATNFATQPAISTMPLPGLAGEAVLPSTVDLYVNDALRMRRDVPAGPFSIQNLPVVTGEGEARLVVRDILGRERIITQPFYASPRLLQQGLHDYSYELGFVRENFGIASNDYGRFVAVGTHRFGFNDRFTGEIRGEALLNQQIVGLSGAFLQPAAGVFAASLAGSHSDRDAGGLLSLGFERQSRVMTLGTSVQLATQGFTQLGLLPGESAPKRTSRTYISTASRGFGSFGLAYTQQDFWDQRQLKLLSASYNVTLGNLGFLSLSLLRFLGEDQKSIVGLTFTRPLDGRTSASVNATAEAGSVQALTQVQRNLPAGSGIGYRIRAGAGDSDLREAGVSAQNSIGTYALEASQSRGENSFRGSASGGMVLAGGNAFLSRRVNESFAVAQVGDYPNVRIYADNQLVARTGVDGSAFLPRLLAYQKNSISIEQADLPLDTEIDTVQMDAVPYFRSGLMLKFPVRRSSGALLTVILGNGKPLPAGALARVVGAKKEFPSGHGGQIYMTGLVARNRVRVSWRGQVCEFTVAFPSTTDPLPDLGTYKCIGIKP